VDKVKSNLSSFLLLANWYPGYLCHTNSQIVDTNSIYAVESKICAYCGKTFLGEGWPHIEGDSNRGVLKIEHFCSDEHKYNFLTSDAWAKFVALSNSLSNLKFKK
jgi:hypothetical protein